MRIVFKDLKKGIIKLIPENMDDLWHLYHIIEKGDLVRALTFRTAEQKGDKIRSKKAEKKPMVLTIRVEDVEFHDFSDRLRIHGIIEEGPQDLGSHHTINLKVGDYKDVTIIKEKWKESHLSRIEEAVKRRGKNDILIVAMDDEEACIAVVRNSGIQVIAEIESGKSGKLYESKDVENEYFSRILNVIKALGEDVPILVVGPGFARDRFLSFGREKEPQLFRRAFSGSAGSAGINGVYEALKSGKVDRIVSDNRVITETKLVEKFIEELSRDGAVAYGKEEVMDAINRGAVSHLLILDTIARTEEGEKIISTARNMGSEFTIINSKIEAGKKLEGFGGIAALLRFKIDQ